MRIIVIGAGVVGVAAAWYLAADGHEVTVLDRQPAPARETSYANGGQISVSHAEPWAGPSAPLKILKWMGREHSPLLWRLRADWAQWRWGLDFLAECTTARMHENIRAIVQLGLYSRACLQTLRAELALEYDQLLRGILHFYTDAAEFENALAKAAVMREYGCDRQPRNAAECLAIEPALATSTVPILGGTYTPADESGDARRFVEALTGHAANRGVRFVFDAAVTRLDADGDGIRAVRLADGAVSHADAYVLAAGSYSAGLLRSLGQRIPVYPAKGYSATVPLRPGQLAPVTSLTDDGYKLVFSRLGDRLRIAGTAEFVGHDLALNPSRCQSLMARVNRIFPQLERNEGVEFWAGLRPSTPGNVPLIGRSRWSNLWLDTGHGTLGWTHACGSGRLLADLVAGRRPAIAADPYQPA